MTLGNFASFLHEMSGRYGNTFAFAVPWQQYLFINEPELIREVFGTQQQAFTKSLGGSMRYLLGQGLLTSEDPLHRQMRRIVQPAFHRERITYYGKMMQSVADDFVNGLKPGGTLDMREAMAALALRVVTLTLFGSDESAATQKFGNALALMMVEFHHALMPFGHLRQRLPLPSTQRFHAARKDVDGVIYDLISRRRANGVETGDALSMLLAARDAETGYRPTDEQIRDEIMTFFLAGHETTANLLTWTFYLLSQHPEIDARTGAAATAGETAYVTRVINETLRLYPPGWLLGRQSVREVTLGEATVVAPKTTTLICPLLLHRRADLFPEPLRFDPDRWLNWEPPPFSFLPFGGGARRCIGDEFALHEVRIVVSAIARKYSFAMEPGQVVRASPLVTLRPSGPVLMRAVARTDVASNESSVAVRPA